MRASVISLFTLLCLSASVLARALKASSLVTCMEKSQVTANFFDVSFDPDNRALRYTFDFDTEINGYIEANVDVYAYGFKIISKEVDLCSIGWKQFCPLYPGAVEVDSIQYISSEYVDMIPGIAYTVPDIDAFARVKVSSNGTQVACLQAYFTNGKTVSQTGAKWATAVIAGLGLLSSAIASAFGNSNAASHVSANAVSLFLYFQSVVIVSMQHVDQVPPIAAAWAENLTWSMGLIRVEFMQKIFRWYVQATGGTPTLYLTSSTINILAQRSAEYIDDLYKRGFDLIKRDKPIVLYGNTNVLIFRGIKRLAYQADIENTSVVCTGFTFFILCAYVLIGLVFIFKYGSEILVRAGWIKPERFVDFRNNWRVVLKGTLSRYIYIGFTQLVILSLYEFYIQDSPAVIVVAVLFLILAVGTLGWASFRVITFARTSIQEHKNPAAILYGNQKFLDKYGFFYTMFRADKYWWGIVLVAHILFKAFFIALGQDSGKTQAIAFWIIDMAYLGALIHYKPYLNFPTNILSILIQVVTTVNSFLFTFFSNIFGQPAAVGSVMGWVFFILNAAFSLILLVLILLFCAFIIFSKNPDSRFRPAKDDRTSFQRFSQHGGQNKQTAELLELGLVAKDHDANWESEIHRLKDTPDSKENTTSSVDDEDKKIEFTEEENQSFAGKIARKLTGGRSFKRNKSKSKKAEKEKEKETSLLTDSSDLKDDFDINQLNSSQVDDSLEFEKIIGHRKEDSTTSFTHQGGRINSADVTRSNDFISNEGNNRYQSLDEDYGKI